MSFTPIAIASGGTSTLRISVYNLNANPLTNATWTDTFPSGMTVADPPNMSQTCGGTVTDGSGGALEVGDTSLKLTNGTVPEQQSSGLPGECYVEVDVTSTTPGNLINTIPANHLSSQTEDPESPGSSVEITNTTPASATLNVIGVESPSLSKAFSPNTVFVGETSTLTITIHNNDDDYPLTEVTMFDVLPTAGDGDIKVASPPNASLSGCGEGSGAELTDESGTPGSLGPDDTTIKLVDGIIDPNADCVISVDVVSLVQGAYTNEIPGDDPAGGSIQTQQGVTNEDPADDPLNVQAFTIDKDFAESTIAAGQTTDVTIEIVNNATIDYTGAALDDILPDGLVFEPGSASFSCTDGSSTASFSYLQDTNPNDTLSMTGAVLPAKTTCTIAATARALMSATVGTYTNQIPIGALTTTQGAINHGSTSDSLDVVSLSLTKDFAETEISIGGTSLVTITISNPSPQDFTNAGLVDVLPEGLVFVDDGSASTSCPGGSVSIGTDTEPNDQITLSGADLPGGSLSSPGTCTITATVQADPSKAPDNHQNLIPAGAIITDEGGTNADPASDTINVTGLEISKNFSPTTFAAGQTTTLTITITNPASIPFTNAELSDTLPDSPNDELYFTGTPSTTCGAGTVAYSGTFTTVTLSNGTIPANDSCTITAAVTTDPDAPAANNYNNVIPSGALVTTEGATNDSPANAIVNVDTVRVTKDYNVGTIAYPDIAILTITIQNLANGDVLTGISLSDTLPVGLVIVSDLDVADTTCDFSSTPILVGTAGTRTISLSNGSLDAAPSSCTIVVEVTAERSASSGVYTNTIGVGDLTTAEGPTNSLSASTSLDVEAVSVDKDFQFAGVEAGGTNDLTITLTNHTGGDYTNAAVDDVLPQIPNQALYYTGTPTTSCSSGSVSIETTNYANDTVRLVGGTIPAYGTCTINASVTTDVSATDDSYINIIPVNALTTSIPSGIGPTNTEEATAPVYVYTETQGVAVDKTFTPSAIDIFENSLLRLIFTAPPDTELTDFSFTDNLPSGVTVSNSTAPTASNCGTLGGSWPPANGATSISATGGTIPRGESCTVDVYVTSEAGTTPGAIYTNTITPDDVSNTEDRNPPGDVTADLTVTTPSTLIMVKDFDPNTVGPDGRSRLTITLENTDTTELVDVDLDDFLPGNTSDGVVIAPNPNPTTTCGGGVITAVAGSQTIHMEDGTIPASDGTVNGICTINVTVQGKTTNGATPATYTNTIPVGNVVATLAGTPSTMNPQDQASDDLTVRDLDLEIVKGFNPLLVYGGADSVMSITLRNPNDDADLIDITFTDYMPAGDMILVDPPNFDPTDCGPAAVLTRIDASTFEFSGGYLAAGEECTITLKANMTVNGNRTNTIPVGAVSTTNGATNKTATSATLTNLASVSVSKSFEPNPVASGLESYSVLTIEIRTTESVAITGLGLIDTLPTGLQVADYVSGPAPAPTNGCGGTLSAPVASTTIALSNGGLGIGFSKCVLTIPVAGAEPGAYTNQIPQGSITNNEKITNIQTTRDTLTLTPYSLGNRVWYDTNNDGIFGAGEVGISGVRVELYRDTNNNGVYDLGVDAAVVDGVGNPRFETTDGDGYYRFDDLV
ncbi:MAG: SdrD B-like domain-containing protein, partial [Anaerolineales bacterium]